MDTKTVVGKSVFFIALCLFVTLFTMAFGQENSLVGVFVVIIALMMLGKDMSVRPLWNLGGLLVFTLAMGLGSFISLIDPFLGLLVNIAFVFTTVFVTMHDLNSPMHFPFLLGYAFMLSMPVTAEQLPIRILALVVGSVFTVGFNVLLNGKRMKRTTHNAIISICAMIRENCDTIIAEDEPDIDRLDRLCSDVNQRVYDRLRDRFFTTPADRPAMDVIASLQGLGRAVCTTERNPEVLRGVSKVMEDLEAFENDDMDLDSFRASVSSFLSSNHGANIAIVSSLRSLVLELEELTSSPSDRKLARSDVPLPFRFGSIMRENLRRDSVKFTFAVRMTLLFATWAFIWQYWGLENAKWLLFTTVALVQPYVEGSWAKSAMRVTGTLMGAGLFVILVTLFGGTGGSLMAMTMIVGYVYTVLDPKRYDAMMVFITLMALLSASMADPSEPVVLERVLYILAGVALATLANHALLPYRIRDENLELSSRYLQITSKRFDMMGAIAKGDGVHEEDRYLRLTANNIAMKIQINVGRDPDDSMERFLGSQNSLMAECTMVQKALSSVSTGCKERFITIVGSHNGESPGTQSALDGMSDDERELLLMAENAVLTYRKNRALYTDIATGV